RVARSRLCFSLFAPLLLRPEIGEPLSLGFLTLALRFRLGCGFGYALLLCLRGSQALFFSLLGFGPCFRLGCGFGYALLLCLRGSLLRLSVFLCFSGISLLLLRGWLHSVVSDAELAKELAALLPQHPEPDASDQQE